MDKTTEESVCVEQRIEESVQNFEYLENVCKEVLRLDPPAAGSMTY